MLKNPLTDAYSNIQEDENYEEQNSSGFLVWGIWTIMTVLSVSVLTVSVISLIVFNIKMESTFQTFQQSTLMLAPTMFNLDCSRLPPPFETYGNDWGVMDSLYVGTMDSNNYYIEVDAQQTHLKNLEIEENIPPQARSLYSMGFILSNSSVGYVDYRIKAQPTFSISGLKDMLMKMNNYPNVPVDKPVHPVVLEHVSYLNVKTVADAEEKFDMCYNQNCQVGDRFIVNGQRAFSVVGWNDNIRSLGMVDNLGNTKIFEGGFIVRLPKQETGHTVGYFTANFSDTMENSICPNAHLVQNWEPVILNEKTLLGEIPINNVFSQFIVENQELVIEPNQLISSIKKKSKATPLRLRDNACSFKSGSSTYCEKYKLSTNYTYYITSSKNSYPKFIRTFGNDIYDIVMAYCEKDGSTNCSLYALKKFCDELLVKLFIPTDDYMKQHQNGLECSYTLLPYETVLRMNLLIRPTKVNRLGESFMSYDFSHYENKLNGNIPDVKKVLYNQRLKFTDLLFFTTN